MIFSSKPKYDFIIVGLGNPGDKYTETRHNLGFKCIDVLIKDLGTGVEKKKYEALLYEAELKGKKLLLVKPLTFMNNSGTAVSQIVKFFKTPADKVIVVSDDVSMDAGRLRIRKSGSHGGHNGLRDIIELLGTDNIPRVKIGAGQKPHPDYDLADWVLGKPSKEDYDKIEPMIKAAAEAVKAAVLTDISTAMNKYNR